MLSLGTAAVLTATVAVGGALYGHRRRRTQVYRDLATARGGLLERQPSPIALDRPPQVAAFARYPIAATPGALSAEALGRLREEVLDNRARAERSFIPLHKQGGTLSYEALHRWAPACLRTYHDPALRAWLSRLVGAEVRPTADHDQSSCSLLYYTEPGDHIGWHFDHNFYRGRHFTVLIALVNEGPGGTLSSSRLEYRDAVGEVASTETAANTLVAFEGARVRHRVTPLGPGETRIQLSMTFATDPRVAWGRELVRRAKDTAYYGPRALWD